MRIPASIQGMLFAPVLICLFFVLKAFCPESAGNSCFADQFAVPIFLPLVAIYKIFGDSSIIGGHEFLLILVYWAFIGLLLGFLFDLFRPTRAQVSQPGFVPPAPPKDTPAIIKEIPKPVPSPKPLPPPPPPPPPVTSIPIMKVMPTSPAQIPRAYQVQPVAQNTLATKPWTAPVPTVPEPPKPKLPINILDRKKEDWPTASL